MIIHIIVYISSQTSTMKKVAMAIYFLFALPDKLGLKCYSKNFSLITALEFFYHTNGKK